MLKRVIAIILIIMLVFLCTSCNEGTNNENATIQIWAYDYKDSLGYSNGVSSILSNVKFFCDKNEIPIEILIYDPDKMAYNDYVLKRNTAAVNGNIIIIEDARYISDLAVQHADYTKLDSYDSLFDTYKNRFCIPLAISHPITFKYNDAINYYNIITDKVVITYDEYLQMKQQMKQHGAEFKLNRLEFQQSVDYFLIKNEIKYLNVQSAILKNSKKFKEALKNTVVELCNDFVLYNNRVLNSDIKFTDNNATFIFNQDDYTIYDENSGLTLCDYPSIHPLTHYDNYVNDSILDKTIVLEPDISISPSFFMYKKITNDKIYDVANYIVNENTYLYITQRWHSYSPVFNGEKTRKLFGVDENWQYEGIGAEKGGDLDKKRYTLYNQIYEMLVKDEEQSNILSSYYYINEEYSNKIYDFIADIIIELSNENYDYKNSEINKMIDKKIDEFVTNFNIHYK